MSVADFVCRLQKSDDSCSEEAVTGLFDRIVASDLKWYTPLTVMESRIGKRTHAALLYLALDDGGILSSSLSSFEFATDHFVVPDETCRSGFRVNMNWTDAILTQTSLIAGTTLRDSSIVLPNGAENPAISTRQTQG